MATLSKSLIAERVNGRYFILKFHETIMSVLVLNASGKCGKGVCRALVEEGFEVSKSFHSEDLSPVPDQSRRYPARSMA